MIEQIELNLPDVIALLDENGVYLYASLSHEVMFGIPVDEIIGKDAFEFVHVEDRAFLKARFDELLQSQHYDPPVEFRYRHRGGYWVVVEARANPIVEHGKGTRIVIVLRDIVKRKQDEEIINYMLYHDALTGLPNRRYIIEQLLQSIEAFHRDGRPFAILFIDLDGFKEVNDTFGHVRADQVLRLVAKRFVRCAGEDEVVARMGGDEFMILLRSVQNQFGASVVAQNILDEIRQAFIVDDREVHLTASIGISICPTDGNDADTLMAYADTAMYKAKAVGKNAYA